MILQLNPPVPVVVKDTDARAIGWIDYGTEFSLIWICALENGECWLIRNEEIRFPYNWTMNYDERYR